MYDLDHVLKSPVGYQKKKKKSQQEAMLLNVDK